MYCKHERTALVSNHASVLGGTDALRDSQLLQTYATFSALRKLDPDPEKAYQQMIAQYSSYSKALRKDFRPPFNDAFIRAMNAFSDYSLQEFLTYIVPGTVCDPQRLSAICQKSSLGDDCVILVYYIIQIRLVAYRLDSSFLKHWNLENQDGYDNILDKIYAFYTTQDKSHALTKDVFLQLYSAINTFQLNHQSLVPHPLGFKTKDILDLMSLLTDQLQITRSQQIEMVYRFFVCKEQAAQILSNQTLYNFTSCKDEKKRIKLATKAIRLIAKISPLELLCAITTRKKAGSVNSQKRQEGLVHPNNVPLETGVIYPIMQTNLGTSNAPVLILFPTVHFLREALNDPSFRNRTTTYVFQDDMVAQLLRYQFGQQIYAPRVSSNISVISYSEFTAQYKSGYFPYQKIFLLGGPFDAEEQQLILHLILSSAHKSYDLYALLSTYTIDNAMRPLLHILNNTASHLDSVALIPQGINNSTFPRRKIWIHCKHKSESAHSSTKIYTLTLNTSLKTQAISPMLDSPVTLEQSDVLTLDCSIRTMFDQEMMLRHASGRERNMAFSHELTPDILVWCSRSYPNKNDDSPRLEAYICLPPSDEKSSRGAIIASTKKRVTNIRNDEVVNWLERDYPFSYVRERYTPEERKALGPGYSLKPMVSIRDQIIASYTPVLQGKNITLKTLWYLYPNLQDYYTQSDYEFLSEMMYTVIGQQRVADLTAEKCEQQLLDTYSGLSQTALWRYYGFIVTAIDFAVSLEYCARNLLKEALHQAKTRDKLFAQVRNVMVKKHFSAQEMQILHQFIQASIQNGKPAYLGVLIRLLTGLDSNVVCALRWCDLRHISEYDVTTFVITRQLSLDGTEVLGFSDAEDYLCFPVPCGLCAELERYQKQIKGYSHNASILGSIVSSGKKVFAPVPPSELNDLTKKAVAQLHIDERIIMLPDNHGGTRFTNLNKYSGDLIRENFRFWATKTAKLNADELNYLLRNKCPSTLGRFYCDFLGDASQLVMSRKLSRWEATIKSSDTSCAQRHPPVNTSNYHSQTLSNDLSRQEVICELFGSGKVDTYIQSEYGIQAEVIKIEQTEVV